MNTLILTGRRIFLFDAMGAIISVLSLLIPLTFEELFGMPKSAVSIFIFIAIAYSIYSTTIYFSKIENWKPYLTLIAFLNIFYCAFTVYHLLINLNTITLVGYIYFVGEIMIILTLSIFELKLSMTKTDK